MRKFVGNNTEMEGISTINEIPVSSFVRKEELNYIVNGSDADTEIDLVPWTGYVNTAGVAPINGLGGSSSITWNRITTNTISGKGHFRFVKPNSNVQGQGRGINFVIESRHLGKLLQISFDAKLHSGSYSNFIRNAFATYTRTSNVVTVNINNTFGVGSTVNVSFTSGGLSGTVGNYVLTAATATSFSFNLTGANITTSNCIVNSVSATLRAYIVQNPNTTPVVIEPVSADIELGNTGIINRQILTFQTHITFTNYRLCIHVSDTSTVECEVDFNNFKVWETQQSVGSINTDWVHYTPITQGLGTITSNTLRWRRVGSNCEIRGNFRTGTTTADEVRVGLPPGLVANITSTTEPREHVGLSFRDIPTTVTSYTLHTENGFSFLNFGDIRSDSTSNPFTRRLGSTIFNTSEDVSLYASVPIQGWGSSVAMSTDSGDGRIVAARYFGGVNDSLTNPTTPMRYTTIVFDTHNCYNTTNGIYTIPFSGLYRFSFSAYNRDTGGSVMIGLYKNGVFDGPIGTVEANNNSGGGSLISFCNARDQMTLRGTGNANIYGWNNFQVERIIPGSQQIALSEKVEAIINFNGNVFGSSGNPVVLVGTSKIRDTHNAYHTTGGNAGYFVAPQTRTYLFDFTAVDNGTNDQLVWVDLFDGTNRIIAVPGAIRNAGSAINKFDINIGIPLLAGQRVAIRGWAEITITESLAANNTSNRLTITGL